MKVTNVPHSFIDGETLSPRDINDNLEHLAETITEIQRKRYCYSVLILPLFISTLTAYSDSTASNVRSYRINLPYQCVLERCYLRYYGTGTTGTPVTVSLLTSGGALPSGASSPHLSVEPTSTAGKLEDYNSSRVVLEANTEYVFTLESDASFSSAHSYLELHLRADRFNVDGSTAVVSYSPSKISTADADSLNAEFSSVDSAVASLTGNTKFQRVEAYVFHGWSTGTDVELTKWKLPAVDTDSVGRNLKCIYAVFERASVALGDNTYSVSVKDGGGSSVASLSVSLLTGATTGKNNTTLSSAVSIGSSTSDPHSASDDYTLEVSRVSGTDTVTKFYVLLVYE